jgi:predicted AAA+ superfamily ATPase
MIQRHDLIKKVMKEFEVHQVCGLLGPRQCGKTTLAKLIADKGEHHYFDCENSLHLARLEDPLLTLGGLSGLIIIDEVQLRPDLFSHLRVLVDEDPQKCFLITGSASRDLISQGSQTLAGRIGFLQITPFTLEEVTDWQHLWKVGGFPKSYLAKDYTASRRWRDEYIKTFLERDLAMLGFDFNPVLTSKLWRMLAHYHGQILNYAELAYALGADQRTVKKYIYALEGTFMIRLLKPWFSNMGKREVKTPKVFIRDTGLLHRLLQIHEDDIENHPKRGFSFEGFVIENLYELFDSFEDAYFWAQHSGAELDFLINFQGQKLGFEIKMTDKPTITASIKTSLEALKLDKIFIITPHKGVFDLSDKVSALGIEDIVPYFKAF